MSLPNNTEIASWVEKPPIPTLRGIRHFFTRRVIDLLRTGTLFDGALLSDIGGSMIVPQHFLKPKQTKLALILPKVKWRLIAFNPGTSRIFFDPVPIYRGDDVASVNEWGGFRVKGHIELVNEELIREVSYSEALRYIGFPDIYPLIRGQIFTKEMRLILSEGSIHQVTKKWAEKLRLIRKGYSDNKPTWFSWGGWSFKSRKWLPV